MLIALYRAAVHRARIARWLSALSIGGAAALGALSLSACKKAAEAGPAPAGPRPVLRNGLAWYEDAPDAALAAARAEGKLVFVDLWAPWCHTCLSMQSFVLSAEKIPALSRFVLLAINTERVENAAFLARVPVTVWPTFYVLEPAQLSVLGRWLGSGAPAPFTRFLDESERARELARHNPAASNDPLGLVLAADELATRQEFGAAAKAYERALAAVPADWPRRPETLVARMTALHKAGQSLLCLELGASALEQTGNSASAVDFSDYALDCAAEIGQAKGGAADPRVERVRRAVERRLRPLCEAGTPELTPDDRADACAKLADARAALHDTAGARAATLQRLAVLERAVAGLPDDVAVAYDWAFTDTLIALGRASDALLRSLSRERSLPDNYNPPQQAARAYKELGRWNDGLAAIERALNLAYGPRKIGFLTLKADLLLGAGRRAEAHQTLEEQLAAYQALPVGQRQPAAVVRIERRLQDWK